MHRKKLWRYALILLGLYVAYFATGVVLTSNNIVDEWPVAPNTVMLSEGSQRDTSPPDNDGPHIFYTDAGLIARSVVAGDTAVVAAFDTIAAGEKAAFPVVCTFRDRPEWTFTTRLKDSLFIEPAEYPDADSIIAISDIEGNFEALRTLLTANGVMSDDYRWTFGTGRLVLLGDFFDRGLHVTECLWLVYHLEQEAEQAGGKVHFILGNHEIMNMGGDLRYVRNKYRENAALLQADYATWFGHDTELGRWLQAKNVVEKIGDLLFVHGGFSEEVNALSLGLRQINDLCRPHYATDDSVRRTFTGHLKTLYSSKTSPFWYRGYVDEEASDEQIEQTLVAHGATAVVVGHTVVDNVTTLYGGRVVAIDTRHSQGNSQGLLYTGGKLYRIDTSGQRWALQ